jgi:hypothetical protein
MSGDIIRIYKCEKKLGLGRKGGNESWGISGQDGGIFFQNDVRRELFQTI